ncbi:MAG: Cys-Gln thioester bond-forming surface protein [Clostridia bacterium]|nr:Cys-Gln thioester bond-forming surface protein [Clostridia bacterium]
MVNRKRIVWIILGIVTSIIFMIIPNTVNAVTLTTPVYFGVSLIRENSATTINGGKDAGKNIGYAIGNPKNNKTDEDLREGAVIWNIMKYSNSNSGTTGDEGNYYCVREGIGFSGSSTNTGAVKKYTSSYEMKKEKKTTITNNISLLKDITEENYNGLLALADLLYLGETEDEKGRKEFLNTILKEQGKNVEDYSVALTYSDIKAVQQAAIWYFSNKDGQEISNQWDILYNNMSKSNWLNYTIDGSEYSSLSKYDLGLDNSGVQTGSGKDRQEQANILYRYLISESTKRASNGISNSNTKITIYTDLADADNTQPIFYIEKMPETKEFDLALRKYITKIDGVSLIESDSRVPKIDESTLKTGTTATYTQRKDPVIVKTGSVITYNLTIYNEGEKAGRATIIEDQLTEGLQFSKLNTSGFKANYDSETNKLTITREDGNNKNLEPYVENNLQSETIEIECIVTAKADTENEKVLTNIACIKEEFDAVDNIAITSEDEGDFEKVVIEPAMFDLKLVKKIAEVNGTKVPERIESVDITDLANGVSTTATYVIDKDPVLVKKGDLIKYTFRVYNEGDIDGYASEITENIPDGLEFIWSEKTDSELAEDTTLSEEEKEAIKYNQTIWDIKSVNKDNSKVELISTDYLAKGKGTEITTDGANLIKAFDSLKQYKNTINDKNPDYKEISVYLKVTAENATNIVIKNEAAITGFTDSEGDLINDRDYGTDDEDYDNVILQSFDLVLRKFIIAQSKDTTIEDSEYLKNANGKYTRAPIVDTSKLNTTDENGKITTTAIYNHVKNSVEVARGDIVVYMIRVYNEGDVEGYASEITEYLPSYLQYVDSEFNKEYGWTVSEDNEKIVKTTYLDNHIISKTTTNSDGAMVLSYKEVPIMCKVTDNAEGIITSNTGITTSKDENKKVVADRDSEASSLVVTANETDDYILGQEDDEDFEKVEVKSFDLSLRQFITGVNGKDVTSRIPKVKYDKEENKITYEHTKDPVDVVIDDTIIYTIRVYNEGEIDGYASKISDNIPDGLQYLPENELNKQYRWVMYDKDGNETEDITKTVKLVTDYLSKEQGEIRKNKTNGIKENPALLKAFDKSEDTYDENLNYVDVKIAFKVIEPTTSEKTIVNYAQICEDTDKNGNIVNDIDSTLDEVIEGEDEHDNEYIKVNYFDLSLKKWVTQTIVTENGKDAITQTRHMPEQDPEPVVKVELDKKKLDIVTVKFKYSIRVANEGDIAGYAKEIVDYIPEGLKFIAEDNPDWKEENNVISTRKLENKLLQPGESADVEVMLTWVNGKDNIGVKENVAEILECYNNKNAHDIDSTPDNKSDGEDDTDGAPIILSASTGQVKIYFMIGFILLITVVGGIILVKKFVL